MSYIWLKCSFCQRPSHFAKSVKKATTKTNPEEMQKQSAWLSTVKRYVSQTENPGLVKRVKALVVVDELNQGGPLILKY